VDVEKRKDIWWWDVVERAWFGEDIVLFECGSEEWREDFGGVSGGFDKELGGRDKKAYIGSIV
jgi:hypothetical protein